MCYMDFGIAEDLMDFRVEDTRRQAERANLASIARDGHRQRSPGQGNRWVNQMGRQLSGLGLRLEQYGQPHPSPQ